MPCKALNSRGKPCQNKTNKDYCWVHGDKGKEKVSQLELDNQAKYCGQIMDCGHLCRHFNVDHDCYCLHCNDLQDDSCAICYTDTLNELPFVILNCGHIFHATCLEKQITNRWPTKAITFNCINCALCKIRFSESHLKLLMRPILKVEKIIQQLAENYGIQNVNDHVFVLCEKCNTSFYYGAKVCSEEVKGELICGECKNITKCNHGSRFLMYKCRFCCKLATFTCGGGKVHFCDDHHAQATRYIDFKTWNNKPDIKLLSCSKNCQLQCFHPQPGEEFCLGCGICLGTNVQQYIENPLVHLSIEELRLARINKFDAK